MMLFLKVLSAHLLGDFVFQSEKWVKDKEKKKLCSFKLYAHIAIHAVLLLLVLEFNTNYWLGFLLIITSHFGIDVLKIYFQKNKNRRSWFFIDQLLHLIILAVATFMYNPFIYL